MGAMPSPRRRTALLLAAVATAGIGAVPAAAHPFGPPLTANATAQGSTVTVLWSGAEDDWMSLGERTGAFAGAAKPQTGAETIMTSPEVRDYLMANIAVSQSGVECAGSWQGIDDLLTTGARLTFECPQPVTTIDLTVTPLTDINEAYRTVVTAGSEQTLFTAAAPTHQVAPDHSEAVGAGGGGGQSDNGELLLLGGAGALVAGVGVLWGVLSRRRSRERVEPSLSNPEHPKERQVA